MSLSVRATCAASALRPLLLRPVGSPVRAGGSQASGAKPTAGRILRFMLNDEWLIMKVIFLHVRLGENV